MPRLNFLAALGGCQSRPVSPAPKPPLATGPVTLTQTLCSLIALLSSQWFLQATCCRIDWLLPLCLSNFHSNFNSPTKNGLILADKAGFPPLAICQVSKGNPVVLTRWVLIVRNYQDCKVVCNKDNVVKAISHMNFRQRLENQVQSLSGAPFLYNMRLSCQTSFLLEK